MISRDSVGGHYPVKRLGEVVEFLDYMRRPVTESDRSVGPFPYFGANGQQGTIDEFIFNESLILLAEDGGHFGNPERGIAYRIAGKTWVNNHAHVLRPKQNLDLGFLCRVLENYDVTPFVTGTTRGKLTKAGASEIPIPIPPIPEQRRIAAILDQADALRAKRRKALTQLDSLTQSIFIEMFGEPGSNPKDWKIVPLGEVIKDLTDYHANGSYEVLRNHVELLDTPNFALMLRTTDLENNNYSTGVKYITEGAYNFLKKSQVFGGEIIINKIGSAGNVYLAPSLNRPVSLGMNSFLLRIDSVANSRFIYDVLINDFIGGLIRSKVRGAVTKTITKEAVRSIEIPLPPLSLQHEYVNRVEAIENQKTIQHTSLALFDALFASLQHRAFRGEL